MKSKVFAFGLASVAVMAQPVSVFAATPYDSCFCVTSAKAGSPSLGSVANPGSGVQISGAGGFVQAADGDALGDGSELTIGAAGGGSAKVGQTCSVELKAFRLISVSQPEGPAGKICVKVADVAGGAAPGAAAAAGVGGGAGIAPVVIGLGAAVAGGLAILVFGGGGAPASP